MHSTSEDGPPIGDIGSLHEPHGRAALLLSESLIHSLLACKTLSMGEALEVVQGAIDAQSEADYESGLAEGDEPHALRLLLRITASIAIDLAPGG